MERQLLLAAKVLVERGISVPALCRDVADARGGQSSFAEQLQRRTKNLALCRRVVLADVEWQRSVHARRLAAANYGVKASRHASGHGVSPDWLLRDTRCQPRVIQPVNLLRGLNIAAHFVQLAVR